MNLRPKVIRARIGPSGRVGADDVDGATYPSRQDRMCKPHHRTPQTVRTDIVPVSGKIALGEGSNRAKPTRGNRDSRTSPGRRGQFRAGDRVAHSCRPGHELGPGTTGGQADTGRGRGTADPPGCAIPPASSATTGSSPNTRQAMCARRLCAPPSSAIAAPLTQSSATEDVKLIEPLSDSATTRSNDTTVTSALFDVELPFVGEVANGVHPPR